MKGSIGQLMKQAQEMQANMKKAQEEMASLTVTGESGAGIVRITMTALLYMAVGHDSTFAQKFAHDWAGYFMMPLALGILWVELQILSRLSTPEEVGQVRPVGGSTGAPLPIR